MLSTVVHLLIEKAKESLERRLGRAGEGGVGKSGGWLVWRTGAPLAYDRDLAVAQRPTAALLNQPCRRI